MKRAVQFLNLAGVLALGVLCIAQWQNNRQLNQEINRLDHLRMDQSKKIDERDQTVQGQVRDLDTLREHLTRLTGELKEAEGKLALSTREAAQLSHERDELKQSVDQWAEAVADRDARLDEANESIHTLAGRLSDAILKFNELATNYNQAVTLLNERAGQ